MPSSSYKAVLVPPGEMIEVPPGPGIMLVERQGENSEPTLAMYRCPCGCKETIKLPLLMVLDRRRDAVTKPKWTITLDQEGNPTIDPVISGMCTHGSSYLIQCGKVTFLDSVGNTIKHDN